ncbi:hypothetical protein ACE3MQ_15570 [Paenibacillus lentus]|uniref:hypothetical protein n=1 Tax=Paenibacillus lentus TaxID=1338368 RepID=UPI00365DB6C6
MKKTILTAAAVIGAGALLFQGLTQAATAAEIRKVITVNTDYSNVTSSASQAERSGLPDLPEGYIKANYKVDDIKSEYYRDQKPASMDLTKEEAAEIGAQALWAIFGQSLEGQAIELGYQKPTVQVPRSYWNADVLIDGKLVYTFSLDSVTGELFTITKSRTLKEKVDLSFDTELDKNPKQYEELAKKLAKEFNVVHGEIKSVKYNSQGYGNNDPTISVDIFGENGEIALMDFSRYDQALTGIVFNGLYKPSMEYHARSVKEMQEKLEEMEDSANPEGKPALKIWSE